MKCNATIAVVGKIMTYETCGIPKNVDQDSPLVQAGTVPKGCSKFVLQPKFL